MFEQNKKKARVGRKKLKSLPLFAAVGLSMLVLSAGAKSAHAELLTGLNSNNQLLTFDSASPNTIQNTVTISGLQAGETLSGIDYRPATRGLYSVGSTNRIYTINTTTGVATSASTLNTATNGTAFGIDFNPTVDRLRLVSDADQDFRVNVDTGAVTVDGTIVYDAGDANAGANPNIVGSAYTNSFAGAATTTLYAIDSNLNILTTQAPPNNGTLNTIGALGFDTNDQVGFDISGTSGIAYASMTALGSSNSQLFTINLTTGKATLTGTIGGTTVLRGLAVAPVPEPGTYAMMGLGLMMLVMVNRRKKQRESLSLATALPTV